MTTTAAVASLGAILFTDLVGSTELRSSLGEEAADELRRQHDQLITDAVSAHGGRVVKGLGDGLMASFPGAAEAVLGAVAAQRSLRRWCRRSGQDLAVRIGVSAGDVTWEDGDCFGTPVVEAARMCAAAAGGQILISDIVRLLAGSRGQLSLSPVGDLKLKGLPEPVMAWEVEWAESMVATAAAVLPPGLSTEGQFGFVARAPELEVTARALKLADAGERRGVLIAGEPGVGKTRLCAELCRRAQDDGAVVLYGRCDEELGIPYQPFVEALRWSIRHTAAEDLTERLGPGRRELARLAPELSGLLPDLEPPLSSDPEVDRARLFDAVESWLGSISEEAAVVFVLDDLHWAGRPTLLLLRHLLRSASPLRLLVLGTYRDTDLARTHPLAELLADLRREPTVERLRMTGLNQAGVRAFVEAAAGREIDEEEAALVRLIHAETDGNPFFVTEVLYHLDESGAVYQSPDGHWHVRPGELSIPEGVREVVGRRVSRLSEAGASVLATASLIGAQFSLAVLGAVSELPADKVESGIEEASGAGLIREVPEHKLVYRFSHALVRSTLYEEISTLRRVRLHRQVGEAIEIVHAARLEDHVVELAHHFSEAAASGDVSKAVRYSRQAGRLALCQAAFDEAMTWAGRALEFFLAGTEGTDLRTECELRLELGLAQREAGDPAHRQTLLEAGRLARAIPAADLVVEAAVLNTRETFSRYGDVDRERVEALEAALGVCHSDADRSRVAARLATELTFSGERDRIMALLDIAVEAARSSRDDDLMVWALTHKANAIIAPETLDERLALLSETSVLAPASTDYKTQACGSVVFYPLLESGQVGEAAESVLYLARIAETSRDPLMNYVVWARQAALLTVAGRLADAEAAIACSVEFADKIAMPEAEIVRLALLLPVRVPQGRAGELTCDIESAFVGFPTIFSYRAFVHCAAGEPAEAAALIDEIRPDNLREHVDLHVPWSMAAVELGLMLPKVGRPDLAEPLYQLLSPYSGQFCVGPTPHVIGGIDSALAACAFLLGDLPGAERHLRAAIGLYDRMSAPIFSGRAQLMLADLLRQMNRDSEAAACETNGESALRSVGLQPMPVRLGDHP